MNLILSILLWVGAISPNSTYHQSEIDALEIQYAPIIELVESSPIETLLVLDEERNDVISVQIIDITEK